MSPEDVSNEMLHYRLISLEKTVERQDADMRRFMEQVDAGWKNFSERVDKRFGEISTLMGNLAYVPRGEHAIAHQALEERLAGLVAAATAKAEGADRHSWWAIALIVSLVIGSIITATLNKAF